LTLIKISPSEYSNLTNSIWGPSYFSTHTFGSDDIFLPISLLVVSGSEAKPNSRIKYGITSLLLNVEVSNPTLRYKAVRKVPTESINFSGFVLPASNISARLST
jgi:hypothetical protein